MAHAKGKFQANPEGVSQAKEWYSSTQASVETLKDWDCKTQLLGDAVMAVLATGSGIMFGVTRDGSAVSVTLYMGDSKVREYANDSVDLDDLMDKMYDQAARFLGKRGIAAVRAIGD